MSAESKFTLEQVIAAQYNLNQSIHGILQAWLAKSPLLFLGIDPHDYYKTLYYKDGTAETTNFDLQQAAVQIYGLLLEGSIAILIDPHLPPSDIVKFGYVEQKNYLGNVINHVPVCRLRPDYADYIPGSQAEHPKFAHQLMIDFYQFFRNSLLSENHQPLGKIKPPQSGLVGIRKPN